MSEINTTTILEANRIHSIDVNAVGEARAKNNGDYIVQVPPVVIPRGSTISINSAIINQKGASNDEIIELSDRNVDSTHPYMSSYQVLEIMYYINNNAVNSVACPYAYTNGYKMGTADQNNINNAMINKTIANTPATADNCMDPATYNDFEWCSADKANVLQFYQTGRQPTGATASANDIGSPANMKCGLMRYRQDTNKYVYIDPSYGGWWYPTKLKAKTNLVELDMRNQEGVDDPDQISFKLTDQLHFTNPTNIGTNNLINASGSRAVATSPDFFVENMRNFNGKCIINIPANGGGKDHQGIIDIHGNNVSFHPIYSNFAVRDINKWIGLDLLIRQPNNDPLIGSGSFNQDLRGFPPVGWEDVLWNAEFGITRDQNRVAFSKVNGISLAVRSLNSRLYNYQDGGNWLVPLGGIYQFSYDTMNGGAGGSVLPEPYIYLLYGNGVLGNVGYFVKEMEDGVTFELYRIQGESVYPATLHAPLTKDGEFKILNSNQLRITITGGSQAKPAETMTATTTPITLNENAGAYHNGLPYFTMTGSEGGGYNLQQTTGAGNRRPDEFLCIPDKFVVPTNMNLNYFNNTAGGNYFLNSWEEYCRLNEKYYGNELEFTDQQKDVKNWAVDVDIGFAWDYYNALNSTHDGAGANFGNLVNNEQSYGFRPSWQIQPLNNPLVPIVGVDQQYPYQISKFKKTGFNHFSTRNLIRVYSRYFSDWSTSFKTDTFSMNLELCRMKYVDEVKVEGSLDPLQNFSEQDLIDRNIMVIPITYDGTNNGNIKGAGFLNFKNTFGGDGGTTSTDSDYDGYKILNGNFRTCFRVINGCFFMNDPSATTNNFLIPMNNDQCNAGSNQKCKTRW